MGADQSLPESQSESSNDILKKENLQNKNISYNNNGLRDNITRIDSNIQQRLNKGVTYNLKICIRGKRQSGKTMLFRRLQGLPFLSKVRCNNYIKIYIFNMYHYGISIMQLKKFNRQLLIGHHQQIMKIMKL